MRKLLVAILLAIINAVAFAMPVLALTAPGAMSFQYVRAFRNLAESGDMFVLIHVNIPYSGSYPSIPASSTFVFRMFDGTNLIAVARPYVFASFENNGYGDIISGFYFDADNAPAWEAGYTLNIQGVPAYYDATVTKTYSMNSADYSSAVDTTDARADLYNSIITLCNTFASIYPDISLKATIEDSVTLSSYGTSYFRGAIPGIQTMCPQLFYVMTYVPQEMDIGESYNMTLQTQYTARLDETVDTGTSDLKRGATRLGAFLGVTDTFVLGFLIYVVCLALCIYSAKKQHGLEAGLFISILVMIGGALLIGSMLFTLMMIVGIVAAIGIFYTQVMKRA